MTFFFFPKRKREKQNLMLYFGRRFRIYVKILLILLYLFLPYAWLRFGFLLAIIFINRFFVMTN
jgi:hypothetical protein